MAGASLSTTTHFSGWHKVIECELVLGFNALFSDITKYHPKKEAGLKRDFAVCGKVSKGEVPEWLKEKAERRIPECIGQCVKFGNYDDLREKIVKDEKLFSKDILTKIATELAKTYL
ncbi:MAG: hypothetical protein J7K72_00445 [Candidatus Aenigmarchaeota archaeon]|nr:hypothetical protein [Candidatus Aenigmarchaeota archaeon]